MNRRKLLQGLLSTAALTAIPGASVVTAMGPGRGGVINISEYAYLVVGGNWTPAFNAAIRDAASKLPIVLPPDTEYRIGQLRARAHRLTNVVEAK